MFLLGINYRLVSQHSDHHSNKMVSTCQIACVTRLWPLHKLQFYQLGGSLRTPLKQDATQKRQFLVGGFNPPDKKKNQIGSSSQLLGKIEHVPNHQPDSISWDNFLSMVFSHGTETVPFLVSQDNDWSAIFFVAVCAMVTGETVAVGVLVGLCQECDRFFAEIDSGIFRMLQFKKVDLPSKFREGPLFGCDMCF